MKTATGYYDPDDVPQSVDSVVEIIEKMTLGELTAIKIKLDDLLDHRIKEAVREIDSDD